MQRTIFQVTTYRSSTTTGYYQWERRIQNKRNQKSQEIRIQYTIFNILSNWRLLDEDFEIKPIKERDKIANWHLKLYQHWENLFK